MQNKVFFITGASGFVAKHFVEYLNSLDEKFKIFGVDISDKCLISDSNFEYKKINLLDFEELKTVLNDTKPDYILHLASVSSVFASWKNPKNSFVNNTNIFLNLVEALRELNINPRVLSIGSSEEYGDYDKTKMPLQESYRLKPLSPYAIARVSQEMLSEIYAKGYGLNIIMTRSFNHIGPGQKDVFVIPSFIKQLYQISCGKQNVMAVGNIDLIRDFLDVRDVVRAYYLLLTKGKIGEVYNVCSAKGTKLRDIIDITSSILNIKPVVEIDKSKLRKADAEIIIGDNSKIFNDLGWEPHFELKQSVNDILNCIKE